MSSQTLKDKPKNVVIVAGEASGDAHAARLVNELKKLDDSISFRGMGGDSLREAGVDVFIDMAKISVVGFVEVLNDLVSHSDRFQEGLHEVVALFRLHLCQPPEVVADEPSIAFRAFLAQSLQ